MDEQQCVWRRNYESVWQGMTPDATTRERVQVQCVKPMPHRGQSHDAQLPRPGNGSTRRWLGNWFLPGHETRRR